MMKDLITTGQSVSDQSKSIRDGEYSRFLNYGLPVMAKHIGISPGYPLFYAGFDGHGKTHLLLELLLQQSELHGHRHLLFTGEAGKPEEIYAMLYHKCGRKPYVKVDRFGNHVKNHQTDQEAAISKDFVDYHFFVVDITQTPDIFRFNDFVKKIEEFQDSHESKVRFNTVTIDPYYEISREDVPQTDQALMSLFGKIYRYCQKEYLSVILTNHIIKPDRFLKTSSGTWYPDMPNKYNWAGGQAWARRGYQMFTMYRPSSEVDYSGNGDMPQKNEVWIIVEKSKPDGVGRLGIVKLFFDSYRSRYYELNPEGESFYSFNWWANG